MLAAVVSCRVCMAVGAICFSRAAVCSAGVGRAVMPPVPPLYDTWFTVVLLTTVVLYTLVTLVVLTLFTLRL